MQTKGGRLAIQFERQDNGFKEVFLVGPALLVFKGEIEL
jgi:diaminopimelate epimerase